MSTGQLERPAASADAPAGAKSVLPVFAARLTPVALRVATRGRQALAALDRPEAPAERYEPGVTRIWRALFRPMALGFFATVAILAGASQPNSPFTLKSVPGAWWFGIPVPSATGQAAPPGQGLFLGVIAVYAGMLLMIRAWYDIVRICSGRHGIPVRYLVPVLIAWLAPLLIVAPLFSRDAYSYAAQGELMAHHLNPYLYGPKVLGPSTQFVRLTDPLWQQVSSPYGPTFLTFAGWIVVLVGHNPLAAVEGMRLLALAGVVLFAAAVPVVARSFNRDGSTAFALAALNPLVLLHLVGGAHNDALMLGLVVVGYAVARRGHPIMGIVLCAFAASVKVPAVIGAIYIGWEWLGSGKTPRERLRPLATALLITGAVMAATSEAVGLGWGWISGLSNPDTVRSWLDPATGIGLFAGKMVAVIGLGYHSHILLTLARGSALALAAAVTVRLLWRSEEIGSLRALGLTLIAVVVLSPVVQPWYAAWGFVFLAPIAERRMRRILMFCSGAACFLQLPGGRVLLNEITVANPLLVALASGVLVVLGTVIVAPRLRRRDRPRAELVAEPA